MRGNVWRCGRRLFGSTAQFMEDTKSALKVLSTTQERFESVTPCKHTRAPEVKYGFVDVPEQIGVMWGTKPPPKGYGALRVLSRSCYKPIFSSIWKHNTELGGHRGGVVLLGNPGNGKTAFLCYSIWKLLNKKVNMVIKFPDIKYYFCVTWPRGELVVDITDSDSESLDIVGFSAWYLADTRVPLTDWKVGRYKFLLTCSPLKANFKEFAKGGQMVKLYHPVWSLDELLALNEHNFNHDVEAVKERFDRWGGIPRFVLDKVDTDSQNEIDRAIGLVRDVDNLQSLPEDESHQVLHLLVDETTYQRYTIGFASPYAMESVYSSLPAAKLQQLCEQPAAIRTIQGQLFEIFVTRNQIKRGGMLSYKQLQVGLTGEVEFGPVQKKKLPPIAASYNLGGSETVFPVIPGDHRNALFKPEALNNAEWDFIAHGAVYQVTVEPTRPLVLGKALEKALAFLRKYYGDGQELEFYFLVPSYLLDSFKLAWWKSKDDQDNTNPAAGTAKSPDDNDNDGISPRKTPPSSKKTPASSPASSKAAIANRQAATLERMKELNIVVKVAYFEASLCPACKGEGILIDE